MITATWIMLLVYMGITVAIVARAALKVKSLSDYAVGNVRFSPTAVGLALAASMTSAATFIINPGFIGLYGLSGVISYAVVLPIAALSSLVVLSKGFRKYGQTVKALSLAQWMSSRYKSEGFGLFFAFLALLLITFIVLIVVGLTQILAQSLHADPMWVMTGVVVFVFGYMMFGGANSMVYTNVIQAVLMLVVAFILLGSGYEHFSEGVHGFLAKLKAIDPSLVATTVHDSLLFRDWFEIGFAQFMIGIAIVCQPHIITKALLLKEEREVNRFLTVAVLVEIIFFSVVFTGLYARLMFPDLMLDGAPIKPDALLSAYVVREFPVWIGLVVVLGLISAGISTLEGLIQSISTTVSNDLLPPLFPGLTEWSDRRRIVLNRLIIVAIGLVSALLSARQLLSPSLSVAIFAQNGVYAYFAAAFVPVLFGMFVPRADKKVVIPASVVALLIHFGVYYGELTPWMQAAVKNPAIPAALAISGSLLTALVLYLISSTSKK